LKFLLFYFLQLLCSSAVKIKRVGHPKFLSLNQQIRNFICSFN
ncbi:hypothetical protein LINPERHAP2_LOCUS41386, partial [Linum perenne]